MIVIPLLNSIFYYLIKNIFLDNIKECDQGEHLRYENTSNLILLHPSSYTYSYVFPSIVNLNWSGLCTISYPFPYSTGSYPRSHQGYARSANPVTAPQTQQNPHSGGLVLRLAAVGCFVLVLSNRLCRRLPHLRFRDNQNHHCFAHRNRLLFIVAHVLGASAAASSFRNFVHLSRPPFVPNRLKACAQPFHPIPLLLLL